jgi:hypothetical protein
MPLDLVDIIILMPSYSTPSCSLCSAITSASKSLYIYVSLFANPSYIKNMYFTLLFLVVKLLALYSAMV